MDIENEFFLNENPSLESVLYWKDKHERVNEINEMIERFKFIFDDDREKFYEYNYEFFIRTVALASHYKNYDAFEVVFYFYIELTLDDEDSGTGYLEKYLSSGVTSKNQEFLLREWKSLYETFEFSDFVAIEALNLLIKSGYFSAEIDDLLVDLIQNEDPGMLSSIVMDLEQFPKAKNELKKKLYYVAPMIKYVGGNRFTNPYVEDWIEFAEAYLKYFKNICLDDLYDKIKILREENDQFLIDCLGVHDPRIKKINNKYFTKKRETEYSKVSASIVSTREELMKEEFLDKLPKTYQEWLKLPFLDPAQKEEMIDFMEDNVAEYLSNNKSSRKVGRNDSCPCGSRKKYKKCCLV